MSSSVRLVMCSMTVLLAAIPLFLAAGDPQLPHRSAWGIAGFALLAIAAALMALAAGRAYRPNEFRPHGSLCRRCPDWVVEHEPGYCQHAQLVGFQGGYQRIATNWRSDASADDGMVIDLAPPVTYSHLDVEGFAPPSAGIVAINDDRTIEVIDAEEYQRRTGEEWP